MTSLTGLLSKWPLIRQIRERSDGTGLEAMSGKTCAMHARIDDALGERTLFMKRRSRAITLRKSARVCARVVKTAPSKFLLDIEITVLIPERKENWPGEHEGQADTKLMPHLEETLCARELKYCYP
jgi:hypothetical protein